MSRSASLGESREITLSAAGSTARIRYRERGEGPPVVFVHGLGVNANLWRGVVPVMADAGFRCLAPDWPLGAHELPVPDADLTPPGVAALIAEFLAALDLHDVLVVANDTGGALTQILMTEHPERVGAVVLATVDSFEYFLPPPFSLLTKVAAVPGLTWLAAKSQRWRVVQRLMLGPLAKRPLPVDIVDSYVTPMRRDSAIRADARRFIRGVHNRYTLAAAEKFGEFAKPVLLAWAVEDKFFPMSLAERLRDRLPNATLQTIEDSYTLIPEDRPDELAKLILDFASTHA
ncbi:MAG TPA: alpha/beta hydrolase [Pseudonocardiaceae bacterium]|jgi:pimeloyl-ACP methyl ester carboxylesterase|nr:alpha/beta hydrolase [Pseudonocardiaceae bacterium]